MILSVDDMPAYTNYKCILMNIYIFILVILKAGLIYAKYKSHTL